jgi:hypothetical protein
MKVVIEKNKVSGESSLICGECQEFSDFIYKEFEIRCVYNLEKLVEWAIRTGTSCRREEKE